jgi:DNA-binding LacI/PurR family transcriptional regulator
VPEQTMGTRPTLEAVAAHAGVSRATVSRVVNGGAGVRPPVAEQVREAIQELGYVPNRAARALVTRRTGTIAVIIAEPEFRIFSDPFFERQIRAISRELALHDCQLVLLWAEGQEDHERIARYLGSGHADGALAFSLHNDGELPALLHRMGVTAVFGGRPGWESALPVPYVDCDNRGGARQAVRHLVSLGRRRIAHIAGPADQVSANDRLDGYHDVLPGADPALLARGDFSAESGAAAMAELLASGTGPDAVFAANDLMASGALRTLRQRGLRVPEDVALVGFDDMAPVAETTDPPLTTVHQDIDGMGRLMVQLLMRALGTGANARRPTAVITPTSLVRRASA